MTLKQYKTKKDPRNAIQYYKTGEDFIIVEFSGIEYKYKYSIRSCGQNHINEMKKCAEKGKGLATYIFVHNPPFEEKIKI